MVHVIELKKEYQDLNINCKDIRKGLTQGYFKIKKSFEEKRTTESKETHVVHDTLSLLDKIGRDTNEPKQKIKTLQLLFGAPNNIP